MFKILIVEDNKETLKQLRDFITEEVDNAHAHTAINVPQARRYLEEASEKNEPYHAVVLDLKLPHEPGLTAEVDETLCQVIREKMPGTLVAHITAFDRDKTVRNHLEQAHDTQVDRSFRLAKRKGFADQLVKELKTYLYGSRIEARLNGLFNRSDLLGYAPLGGMRSRDFLGGRSVTHELADLTREISSYWVDLDSNVRAKIKESFNVTEDGDEVTVSLF